MNDEKVIVSKGLLDNIANPLMQATETAENLSLPEMATAAQMMLPSKWELVVDTILEGNISMFMQEIPNADEVAIEISNANGIFNKNDNIYLLPWSNEKFKTQHYLMSSINKTEKYMFARCELISDYVFTNFTVITNNPITSNITLAGRNGFAFPRKKTGEYIGFLGTVTNSFNEGTQVRIWAKRRVSANE